MSISLAAPPRDGEANEELLDYIKTVLQVKKGQVHLASGGKNRNKVVGVEKSAIDIDSVISLITLEYKQL